MEAATSTLTNWEKLIAKQKRAAEKNQTTVNAPELQKMNVAGTFTKAERQCILKICVPNSGVLSKDEKEHIRTFESNNVTIMKMMSDVHQLKDRLTFLQKQLDECLSVDQENNSLPDPIKITSNEDEEDCFSEIEDEMLDILVS